MAETNKVAEAVLKGIQEQLGKYDVIIVVQEQTFECHRFLLSACSRYFRAMFSLVKSADLMTVEIPDISPETFSLVIDYMYKAANVINADNIISVWRAAVQLQIDFLIESCEMFQIKCLSDDNCVDIFMNAKILDSRIVMDAARAYIVKSFENLRKEEDILKLEYDDILKLVTDEALDVPSEDVVIDFILRWVSFVPFIKRDGEEEKQNLVAFAQTSAKENKVKTVPEVDIETKDDETGIEFKQSDIVSSSKGQEDSVENQSKRQITNREKCLPNLLMATKICLVSGTCIQILMENKMVTGNEKTLAVMMEGLRYQLQPGRRHDECSSRAIYRKSSNFTNVVINIFQQEGETMMSCMTMDGKWFKLSKPPIKNPIMKAVTFENDIYATCYNETLKYDSTTNSWRQLGRNRLIYYGCVFICLDNFIYVLWDNRSDIYRFNARDEQHLGYARWEYIGNIKQAVSNLVVTTFRWCLVIFGNVDDNSIVMQCFDTKIMSAYSFPNVMPGSSKNMVTVKLDGSTYLLQETGDLWQLVSCDKSKISLEFQGIVWDFSLELLGAVLCNQELLVFVRSIDQQIPLTWKTKHFASKTVKVIVRDGCCFINNVVPRQFLYFKES